MLRRGEILTRQALKEGPTADDDDEEREGGEEPNQPPVHIGEMARIVEKPRKICGVCDTMHRASNFPVGAIHSECEDPKDSACNDCLERHITNSIHNMSWDNITCLDCGDVLPPDSVKQLIKQFISEDVFQK